MSGGTDGPGDVVSAAVEDAKALVEARSAEEEQLNLLDPVEPEDYADARAALGPSAGNLAVLADARARKRGRPPGARNKRTDDFQRWLLQFGQHPAITLMQTQSTPAEVLMERSRRTKVHSFRKDGTENLVVEQMSYAEAEALRTRCAEGLLPFFEQKLGTAADQAFRDLADLFIEGVTHSASEIEEVLEGEYLPVDDDGEEAA